MMMKKIIYLGLSVVLLIANNASAQQMLQEIIVNYVNIKPNNIVNKVVTKNTPIKVILPKGTSAIFYRITIFQPEKVNTYTRLYETLRLVNPEKLTKKDYDFNKHLLEANGSFEAQVQFFGDAAAANQFLAGKDQTPCFKVEATKSSAGQVLNCTSQTLYIAVKPTEKKKFGTIKVEIVVLADMEEDSVNDRFPFTIQNELNGEIAYEISGDRSNWQAFYLPSKKKAVFKLADSQVYMRVSTLEKVTEEYKIDSGKQYRLYWNKDKNRFDLGEIPPKK